MGDSEETAAQSVLSGDDDNPLAGQDLSGGPSGQPQPTTSSTATASPIQVDSTQKVHPHVAILAGLVNKVLGGLQNAPGNPNNAFDRGFMGASPNQQAIQQANVSKIQSEADMAKAQASMAGLQLLQTKHMVDRLSQADQDKFIQMSNDYYKLLTDKEGTEVSVYGDPKAALAESGRQNTSDARVKQGLGTYVPLIHRDDEGKVQASVVFIPHKDVLQSDLDLGPNPNFDPDKPEDDSNPKNLVIPANTPMKGLPQFAKTLIDLARGDTKDQHKQLEQLNKLPEDNPDQIDAKRSQLQQWVDDKSNDSTFKKHNLADVQATISRLGTNLPRAEKRKIDEAKAMSTQVHIPELEKKEDIKHEWDTVYARDADGDLIATNRKTATTQGYTDIDDTVTKADAAADRRTAPIINDVRGKISDYQGEISKGDLSAMEATEVRGIMALTDSDFEAKLEPFGVGVGIKPSVKQMQEMFRGYDINHLSDKAQSRLATYIAARSSALELQKAQTQTARASKEGLLLDLAQLPNPGIDGRMANKQLDLLLRSIDRISSNNPFVGGDNKTKKLLKRLAGPSTADQ